MGRAKDIVVKPISSSDANRIIKQLHYSGKVVQNSQLHLGVFLDGKCGGALQFGPSLDKRKIQGLVRDTKWNEFIELNRMALADWLPRNGESRAIAVSMRLLRKHYPHLKWVVSFADGTQCGDGTIYRASGFVLTGIKRNAQLFRLPHFDALDEKLCLDNGVLRSEITDIRAWLREITPAHKMSLQGAPHAHKMSLEGGCRPSQLLSKVKKIMRRLTNGGTSAAILFTAIGGFEETGYQLRYIYFLDLAYRAKLTVPELPYSAIEEAGAGMYLGKSKSCASSVKEAHSDSI